MMYTEELVSRLQTATKKNYPVELLSEEGDRYEIVSVNFDPEHERIFIGGMLAE